MRFKSKTALVTGGGTGIGLAVSKRFAAEGAGVVIMGRRRGPLEEAAAELEKAAAESGSGARVRVFDGTDVGDEGAVNAMFESIERDAKLDYIVNNAGVSGPVRCFAGGSKSEFESAVSIHLTGAFWVSARGLRAMAPGGKIITISTFFTEERPLEQRPYRFRSPYTAAQGAKNRLAEALSWDLAGRGIASIATNPGPVHSDRIYKTVYPKAAAEFLRVGGFEDIGPARVAQACPLLLPLLGEGPGEVGPGVKSASEKTGIGEPALGRMLQKISSIAEKIQANTAAMIADGQFLSQDQVAESVLNLCGEQMSQILNGRVVPGDRVSYPVKPHVGAAAPGPHRPDLAGKSVVIFADVRQRHPAAEALAARVKECGGEPVVILSPEAPEAAKEALSEYHTHQAPLGDASRWLSAASSKAGEVSAVVHLTGDVPLLDSLAGLPRGRWDAMVERFVNRPAEVARQSFEFMVPGGGEDPRLYRGKGGPVIVVGPALPSGKKIGGAKRAHAEVFRGALRPLAATVNQEMSDVLKSRARLFVALPGSVSGAEPDPAGACGVLDFALSGQYASSQQVIFCPDESRA